MEITGEMIKYAMREIASSGYSVGDTCVVTVYHCSLLKDFRAEGITYFRFSMNSDGEWSYINAKTID